MKETPDIQPASAMDGLRRGERPTPNIQCQTCEFGTRELTKKEWETKISEPFRFFRVFRGQKKFYLPTKHTKRRENFKDEDRLVHVPSAEGAHIPISDNGQSSRADPIAAAGREIIQDLRPVLVD